MRPEPNETEPRGRRFDHEHNVIAAYPDMDAARGAVEALELGGIDAAHVSLLGRRVEEAAQRTDTRERDERVVEHVGKRAAVGAAAGTVGGGLAGFLAFFIPGVGPVLGAGIWAATAAGGVAGGAVGGMVGGVSALPATNAWELTYQSVREGQVLVGAHAEDRGVVERAGGILARRSPVWMRRFDADGRLLSEEGPDQASGGEQRPAEPRG